MNDQEHVGLTFDHADVVGSVPDGERDALLVPFDEVNDERFLKRRHAAADDSFAEAADLKQQQLHLF